jgi:hypothetical protein
MAINSSSLLSSQNVRSILEMHSICTCQRTSELWVRPWQSIGLIGLIGLILSSLPISRGQVVTSFPSPPASSVPIYKGLVYFFVVVATTRLISRYDIISFKNDAPRLYADSPPFTAILLPSTALRGPCYLITAWGFGSDKRSVALPRPLRCCHPLRFPGRP